MAKKDANLLDMIPTRRREAEPRGDGTVDVLVPRYGDGRLGAVLGRFLKNQPIRLHLDEFGAEVWRLCDGRHSVYEIGQRMEEKFGDRIQPVYERLGLFLHQMKKAGIVDWRR